MTPAPEHTPGSMTPGGTTPSMGATPLMGGDTPGSMTPRDKSMMTPGGGGETPSGMTPGGMTPGMSTPIGAKAMGMQTPAPGQAKRFSSQAGINK